VSWIVLYLATTSLFLAALFFQTTHLQGVIAMSAQDSVNEITAQIKKGTGEVVGKIAELEAANPEVDFSELKAAAQALDDVVADAPVEPAPEPEAPAE
jgi:predicted negative regulator of RcsB-dependent stress response